MKFCVSVCEEFGETHMSFKNLYSGLGFTHVQLRNKINGLQQISVYRFIYLVQT